MRTHRILVCGGRSFGDFPLFATPGYEIKYAKRIAERKAAYEFLDSLKAKCHIEVIIEGGAKGADNCGGEWADLRDIPRDTYKADWSIGKQAGILRNQEMLEQGCPTLGVAFPGGTGTADMVRRLKAAGIPVLEVDIS